MSSSGLLGKKKLPRILPAPEQSTRGRAGEGGSSPLQLGGVGALPPKRQRRAGRFACDACRSKKSAVWPSCYFFALHWRDALRPSRLLRRRPLTTCDGSPPRSGIGCTQIPEGSQHQENHCCKARAVWSLGVAVLTGSSCSPQSTTCLPIPSFLCSRPVCHLVIYEKNTALLIGQRQGV